MIGEGAILMPPGLAFRDIARWIMRPHFSERSFPERSILIGISSDVFMKDPALPPLILHCHVPKTAGVSFAQVLHETFQPFHLHHLHPDPAYVLTPQILETLLEINPLVKSFTSHHLRIFPRRLQNHRPIYITFLREPVAALISLLKYAQREYNNWKPEAQ